MDPLNFPTQEEIDALRRKFFVGPGDDETFIKWGDQAMQIALEWLKNPEQRKIHADISLQELAGLFSGTKPPEIGLQIESVFQECKDTILENSVRVNNPRYIGHMTSAIPWFSVIVNILLTSINQNQIKIETALASTYVERQILAWLHRLVFRRSEPFYRTHILNQDTALGNTTSGGTVGNLTALTVARNRKIPGVREKGLYRALRDSPYKDVAIIASTRAHYSVRKCAELLGLGQQAVVDIPVDSENKISVKILKDTIRNLKKRNTAIIAMVGIAGNTETGNIDPLEAMARVAKLEDIWLHVDAAWGGALVLSKDLRQHLEGIERADSVLIDGHKLLYLPLSHGCVLFREPDALGALMHNANYVLRKGSIDLGRTAIEGSRSFSSLKLWFSLKILGMNGYDILLKKSMRLTQLLVELLDASEDFERMSTPEVCILTYRFVPKSWAARLKHLHVEGQAEHVRQVNLQLNELNVELQKRQREEGRSFVSRTILESTPYPQEIVVLRAVLTNLLTRSDFLKEILEEQKQIGYEIVEELYQGGAALH